MLNSTEFAESAVGAQEGGDEGSDIDLDAMLDEALASVLDRDRDAAVQVSFKTRCRAPVSTSAHARFWNVYQTPSSRDLQDPPIPHCLAASHKG